MVFRTFLRCEYSEENILFWLACEDLKKERSPELIEEKASQPPFLVSPMFCQRPFFRFEFPHFASRNASDAYLLSNMWVIFV